MPASARNSTVFASYFTSSKGVFVRMIRLWIEHNARMLDCGIRPL